MAIEYAEMAEHEVIMGKAHVRYLRVVKADIAEMREARALLLREIEAPWPKQP